MVNSISQMNNKEVLSNRYEIIELIGAGGMSYVYKAYDTKTKKIVAIKVLKDELSDDDEFLSKFQSEAIASEKIKHKNVVSSFDVVDEGRLHYIVLEYVNGITLNKYIKEKKHLSNDETIDIAMQIALGLESAHKKGIIHRDIKPQNIVLTKEGDAKITDFGISRAISSTTKNISVVGTVHYISPEQARNENVDFRSDIYSLGCTMFEMITGKIPFEGDNPVSIIISHLRENISLPSNDNPKIYKSLEKIILKATRMIPSERYQSVSDLIKDLKLAKKDKKGSFIKDDLYEEDANKTVIISDSDINMIKQWSSNYVNKPNSYKMSELTNREREFIKKYLMGKTVSRTKYIWLCVVTISALITIIIISFLVKSIVDTYKRHNTNEASLISTSSNVDMILPNLANSIVGIDIDIARNLMKDYGIEINISDIVYSDKYLEKEIIEVLIDEEHKVLNVIISKGSEVIDFSDIDKLHQTRFIDIANQLDDRGIKYSVYEIYDRNIERGKIIGVNKFKTSEPGELIITISKGLSKDVVTMPDLYRLSLQSATDLLVKNNLVLGSIYYAQSYLVESGSVVDQSIEKFSDVDIGSVVDLTISSGIDGETTEVNNSNKLYGQLRATYIVTNTNIPIDNQKDSIIIAVRLKQDTNEGVKYFELSQPTEYIVGTAISLIYLNIEGEPNVYNGVVQVVDVENDIVLSEYVVQFSNN